MKTKKGAAPDYFINVRRTPNADGEFLFWVYGASPHGNTLLGQGYGFAESEARQMAIDCSWRLQRLYGPNEFDCPRCEDTGCPDCDNGERINNLLRPK